MYLCIHFSTKNIMSHKRAASYDAFNSQPNPNYDLDVTHRIFLILPLPGSDTAAAAAAAFYLAKSS